MERKVYLLENLGCANCAAKIERKINELPGVQEATITFATKQLRITAEDPHRLLPEIQKIARALEPDILVTERKKGGAKPHAEVHDHGHHEHPHEHGTECGCGHHHEHEHHEHSHHEHPHEHGAECGCGHHHEHEHHEHGHHEHPHEHGTECSCGHHHEHEHGHHEHHRHPHNEKKIGGPVRTRTYLVENLGCANCAAKMEERIGDLPQVQEALLTFATRQLKVTAEDPDGLLPEMQKICASIESEVKLIPRERRGNGEAAVSEPRQKTDGAGNTGKPLLAGKSRTILLLAVGALCFVAGEVLEHLGMEVPSLIILVAAYVLLGGKIVLTAVRNLLKGQVFDENFLMSIATLGAFAIAEYPEAVGVMLFYRIGEFFEEVAVEKSRNQIMDAVDMRPEVVNLVEETGEIRVIPAEEAQVGQILLVRPGDRIPLDGVILEGESRIDTSPVTGEPVPVKAGAGDAVTSGCVNTSGLLKMRVDKVLEESMVTRILDSVENAAASKPKIDRFITRFARYYTPAVVLLATATAVIPSLITGEWGKWVYTALTFLVISCPCALVLSVPLAFFSGIGAGSKKGILFKGGVSLEAMKNIRAVVMDKTGTITEGNFVLQKVLPAGNFTEEQVLAYSAASELSSTHPIGHSIVTAARERGIELIQPQQVQEQAGHGIKASFTDAEVLCGNRKLLEENGISVSGQEAEVYGTEVFVAVNGRYAGRLVIADTIKEDARDAIGAIQKLGITPVMLTGDARESAERVAREVGISEVHAKLLPQDKLDRLQKIRSKYGAVMFVGDGINDAPVLAGADVGAAMGSGADAAIEAADAVFMTSKMMAIPQSLAIARSTGGVAVQNVVFALIIKVLVMILGLAGFASMWMAVFADTGVAMLCVLNSIRILYKK